jgi:hypothetical protein
MNCPHCHRPLTQIDYYGELLVGCVECNRWGRPGDKTLIMELLEDDLEALRERGAKARIKIMAAQMCNPHNASIEHSTGFIWRFFHLRIPALGMR